MKCIHGRGFDFLRSQPNPKNKNRQLFLDTLAGTDSFAINTFFQKPPSKGVTYRKKTPNDGMALDWNPTDFFTLAFVVANSKAKKCVVNCESDTSTELNTDHLPLIATIRIKLKIKRPFTDEPDCWKKPQRPEVKELDSFYADVNKTFMKLAQESGGYASFSVSKKTSYQTGIRYQATGVA